MTATTSRRRLVAVVAATVAAAAAIPTVGALAADPTPRVAFVARNDVPFDSLALGPIAGALGGIVVITSPGELADSARDALIDFGADRVYIAGGPQAISPTVEDAVEAAGSWTVERIEGADRNATAASLAGLYDDLGIGRPMLTGGNVSGDVELDGLLVSQAIATGTIAAQKLEVADDTYVAGAAAQDGSSASVLGAPIPVRAVSVTAPGAGVVRVDAGVVVDNTTGAPATFRVVTAGAARDVTIANGASAPVDLTAIVQVEEPGDVNVPLLVIRLTGAAGPLPVAWDDATVIVEYTPAHQASFTPGD